MDTYCVKRARFASLVKPSIPLRGPLEILDLTSDTESETFVTMKSVQPAKRQKRMRRKPSVRVALNDDDDDDDTIEEASAPSSHADDTFELSPIQEFTPTPESPRNVAPLRIKNINAWRPIPEMARDCGVHTVTFVDPGTRNLAVLRVEYCPVVRITHCIRQDLNKLAHTMSVTGDQPSMMRSETKTFTDREALYALQSWVTKELEPGGMFCSDMLYVEDQAFDDTMARVEATILALFNAKTRPHRLLDQPGGSIAAGQVMSARGWKSAYRPLFPLLRRADHPVARAPKRKFMRMNGRSAHDSAQHTANKRAAIKYGKLLVPKFLPLIDAENLTSEVRASLEGRKCDDLYDTLFMAVFFAGTHLHHFQKIVRRGFSAPLPFCKAPPQRASSRFEEVLEMGVYLGATKEHMAQLIAALNG